MEPNRGQVGDQVAFTDCKTVVQVESFLDDASRRTTANRVPGASFREPLSHEQSRVVSKHKYRRAHYRGGRLEKPEPVMEADQ